MKTKGSNLGSVSWISFGGILQPEGSGVLLLSAIMKTLASVCLNQHYPKFPDK